MTYETCGTCGGAGEYVGFWKVEPCKTCEGTGFHVVEKEFQTSEGIGFHDGGPKTFPPLRRCQDCEAATPELYCLACGSDNVIEESKGEE